MNLSWAMPVERLSASSVSKLIQCPEKWRLKYLAKEPEKLFADRFIGLVDHSVHEGAINYFLATGNQLTDDELTVTFAQEWTRVIDREGEPDWKDADPSQGYDRALRAVKLYHDTVGKNLKPVAAEEWIEFEVPGVPIPVCGKLDVLCEDRVIDRKTSKNRVNKPKGDWRLQARIYSYATDLPVEYQVITKQATPQIVTAAESPDLLIQPGSRKATETMVLNAARQINEYYSRFGAENSWPTTGLTHQFACDWCSAGPKYNNSCPIWA